MLSIFVAVAAGLVVGVLVSLIFSTWWAGVKSGRYPKPVKTLGERITAWRVEDIRAFIEHCNAPEEARV